MPLIRAEQPRDFDAVRSILLAAFGREAEARLVDRLRASGKITSALVAEEKDRILGHVVFSRIDVEGKEAPAAAIALAPLAVLPAFQRLGVGSALVSAGLERCRLDRQGRVLVLGDPAYYARFGFVPATKYGIECGLPASPEALLAVELAPGAFSGTGVARYGHEFEDLE